MTHPTLPEIYLKQLLLLKKLLFILLLLWYTKLKTLSCLLAGVFLQSLRGFSGINRRCCFLAFANGHHAFSPFSNRIQVTLIELPASV
ncbi:hypothetical protein Plhal304r1_c006g0023521 [Plasmopara halstedii]